MELINIHNISKFIQIILYKQLEILIYMHKNEK